MRSVATENKRASWSSQNLSLSQSKLPQKAIDILSYKRKIKNSKTINKIFRERNYII